MYLELLLYFRFVVSCGGGTPKNILPFYPSGIDAVCCKITDSMFVIDYDVCKHPASLMLPAENSHCQRLS